MFFNFLSLMILFVLFLPSVSYAIPEREEVALESTAQVVIPRCVTSRGHFEGMRVVRGPFKVKEEPFPFYSGPLRGQNLGFLYLGSLPKHLLEGTSYWEFLDFFKSAATESSARKKTRPPKGNMVIVPLPPYNLYRSLLEYKTLHMTRGELIERYANPHFFSIFYNNQPLNIFILPTVHTLSLDVLPTDIQRAIFILAQTEGSRLIKEAGKELFYKNKGKKPLPIDPRIKHNNEGCIEEDLRYYKELYGPLYSEMPEELARLREDKEKIVRSIYSQGWTTTLGIKNRKRLFFLANLLGTPFQYSDQLHPHYVYSQLFIRMALLYSPVNESLDDRIKAIFSKYGRSVHGLEVEDEQMKAYTESIYEPPEMGSASSELWISLIGKMLEKLPFNESDLGFSSPHPPYRPTLDDLDFGDVHERSYLRGDFSSIPFSVEERNRRWWEETISPLLNERARSDCFQTLPPILLAYGVAHNDGPSSITGWISQKKGFEVRQFLRK